MDYQVQQAQPLVHRLDQPSLLQQAKQIDNLKRSTDCKLMLALKTAYQTDPSFHAKINTILTSKQQPVTSKLVAPKHQTNSQGVLRYRMDEIPEETPQA